MSSGPPPRSIRRGDVFWVDWNPARGSEQAGRRPALIIQTDAGNRNPRYPNTIVAAITTTSVDVPTHIEVAPSELNGLGHTSYVKCEQLITVSKARLEVHLGRIDDATMARVDAALKRALSLA